MYFGSDHLEAHKIIFTNGVEDPWKWVSKLDVSDAQPRQDLHAFVADCENCAHCVELYTEKESDPPELKEIRYKIRKIFSRWIEEDKQKRYGDRKSVV